jgi:hypothetical protein
VGEFFWVIELESSMKSFEKILQFITFFRQKDESLKMLYRRLFKLKRIFKASQTWKLPINIFVPWKVLRHSMRRFCNEFL